MEGEYIIVLDTNQIFLDYDDFSRIFNKNLLDIKTFLDHFKLNNVKICMPEIVMQERITQRTDDVLQKIKELIENHEKLKLFGIKLSKIPKEEYIRKKYLLEAKEIIKGNIIEFPLPKPKINEVIKRAYMKKTPFQSKGKGFKDALIWYSILENCKNKKIILVTDDNAFDEPVLDKELKLNGGTELRIFNTIEKTKSFLRNEFDIDIDIETKHNKIKEDIEKNIYRILFEIIGKEYYSFQKMLIGGFLIKEVSFNNISENYTFVDINVKVKAKLFESLEEKNDSLYEAAMYTGILKTPYFIPTSYQKYPVEEDLIIKVRLYQSMENYNISEYTINKDYEVF